jgi:hypothetical protein
VLERELPDLTQLFSRIHFKVQQIQRDADNFYISLHPTTPTQFHLLSSYFTDTARVEPLENNNIITIPKTMSFNTVRKLFAKFAQIWNSVAPPNKAIQYTFTPKQNANDLQEQFNKMIDSSIESRFKRDYQRCLSPAVKKFWPHLSLSMRDYIRSCVNASLMTYYAGIHNTSDADALIVAMKAKPAVKIKVSLSSDSSADLDDFLRHTTLLEAAGNRFSNKKYNLSSFSLTDLIPLREEAENIEACSSDSARITR